MSNGKQLFLEGDVDGRTVIARRYRDVLAALISDLGGDPSEAQSLLARKAATLAVWTETTEASMAAGEAIDIGPYTTACNSLRRLLADLGLERKVLDVGGKTLRDRLISARTKAENQPVQTNSAAAA